MNIRWHDRHELLEIVPDLNPVDLMGGTFSPEDGNASPLLATHAFYAHALRMGAQFHFNENVLEIITRSGKVVGLKTDQGSYGADVIINAAGAWASEIGDLVGLDHPGQARFARIGHHRSRGRISSTP